MRKLILAAVMATAATPFAVPAPAAAQGPNELRARQDCIHDLRNSRSRREYNYERRDCRHDINQARNRDWRNYRRYDYNSYEPGYNAYYADDYYRDGRYYRERRLSYNDRIYRGRDGRYYCRRSDGTTGLIIGGLGGAVIGNSIAGGGSRTLGALLGGTAGALLGQSIDRGKVVCR
jgi:Ni/Co efflux regulator RcnB